jgi:hypothetical protein
MTIPDRCKKKTTSYSPYLKGTVYIAIMRKEKRDCKRKRSVENVMDTLRLLGFAIGTSFNFLLDRRHHAGKGY